jgi:hypothetical protein
MHRVALGHNILPHPGPLPKEREDRGQLVGESYVAVAFDEWGVLLPLPEGEGWGEGGNSDY